MVFIVQREATKGKLIKREIEALIKKKCNVKCSFTKGGFTMDICRRRDIPWMAADGGTHLSVDLSYQVAPNTHTKCVLLSKMWSALDSYLTKTTVGHNILVWNNESIFLQILWGGLTTHGKDCKNRRIIIVKILNIYIIFHVLTCITLLSSIYPLPEMHSWRKKCYKFS